MLFSKNLIITGGAGFIGSHVVRQLVTRYPDYRIVNLDALTYAGNLENLRDIESNGNYVFEKVNILDTAELERIFSTYQPDGVIHLAAESHVDRSIDSPLDFVYTNVIGTVNLLNAAKKCWQGNYEGKRFYHVSTDEVYGALGDRDYYRTNKI
jgi:dTDP-glucose 4,6-dehydratase